MANTGKVSEAENPYFFENQFYKLSSPNRIAKLLAQYELYKRICNVPGVIIECGVFRGSSLFRLATFRHLLENENSRKIIGFDTFGKFPTTNHQKDHKLLGKFTDSAGEWSLSRLEILDALAKKGIDSNIELVEGDILRTVPEFIKSHPELKIALLHIDVDLREATKVSINDFYPYVSKGGIIALDDYGYFSGANQALDQFTDEQQLRIEKLPFAHTPSYIIK